MSAQFSEREPFLVTMSLRASDLATDLLIIMVKNYVFNKVIHYIRSTCDITFDILAPQLNIRLYNAPQKLLKSRIIKHERLPD